MKSLLISDIHGNYEALKRVLKLEDWDRVYCMGDIVDYGPSPDGCARLLREQADHIARGNHDNAVAFGVDCGCGYEIKELSIEVRRFTLNDLTGSSLEFLRNLPLTSKVENKLLVHASPEDLFSYLKPTTPSDDFHIFDRYDEEIVLLGHTHIPMDRKIKGKRYINPGSLGQPRDGDWRPSYCIMVDENITFQRLDYDIDSVIEKMEKIGLPDRAIRILREGKVVP